MRSRGVTQDGVRVPLAGCACEQRLPAQELLLPQYVDADVVAQVLDVSRDSVYRWARDGTMDGAYRFNGLWRFEVAEVLNWADKCRQRRRSPR